MRLLDLRANAACANLENRIFVDMFAEHFFKYGGALGALMVGVVYFLRARHDTLQIRRLLCAAYAPASAMLFLAGVWLAPVWLALGRSAFSLAQLLIVPLIFYSFAFYSGHWEATSSKAR